MDLNQPYPPSMRATKAGERIHVQATSTLPTQDRGTVAAPGLSMAVTGQAGANAASIVPPDLSTLLASNTALLVAAIDPTGDLLAEDAVCVKGEIISIQMLHPTFGSIKTNSTSATDLIPQNLHRTIRRPQAHRHSLGVDGSKLHAHHLYPQRLPLVASARRI